MKTFTVRRLWRMAAWGALTAGTLLAAGFATRSEIGAQRTADILTTIRSQSAALLRPARQPMRVSLTGNREGETRRLADAVSELAAESDQIKARIAAVERNMDDVTGSLSKDIEAAKAANPIPYSAPWPGDASPAAPSPAAIANVVKPVVPRPDGLATPLPPAALMSAGAAASPPHPTAQYAVDLGSAESIEALRVRWTAIHAVHAQLFDGLVPAVTLKTVPRSNRVELRLMVGPLPSEELATQLCASLKAARRSCEPVVFSTERLALQ